MLGIQTNLVATRRISGGAADCRSTETKLSGLLTQGTNEAAERLTKPAQEPDSRLRFKRTPPMQDAWKHRRLAQTTG